MKRLSVILLLVLASPAWAGLAEDLVAADAKGDYATELRIAMPFAQKGADWAQSILGDLYEGGLGVKRDYYEAVKWYRLAAAQGLAMAQYNLGLAYKNGKGVLQDTVRAHMWFNIAAFGGVKDATKKRDVVARKMTPQQIGEAQTLARDCQARQFKGCE